MAELIISDILAASILSPGPLSSAAGMKITFPLLSWLSTFLVPYPSPKEKFKRRALLSILMAFPRFFPPFKRRLMRKSLISRCAFMLFPLAQPTCGLRARIRNIPKQWAVKWLQARSKLTSVARKVDMLFRFPCHFGVNILRWWESYVDAHTSCAC